MADLDNPPVGPVGTSIPTETTRPDRVVFHEIMESQLNDLADDSISKFKQLGWACAGVAGGTLPGFFAGVDKVMEGANTFSAGDLAYCGTFIAASAAAFLCYLFQKSDESRKQRVLNEIRSRTNARTGTMTDSNQ